MNKYGLIIENLKILSILIRIKANKILETELH